MNDNELLSKLLGLAESTAFEEENTVESQAYNDVGKGYHEPQRSLFVKVKFPRSTGDYDYLCDDYTVQVGEWVMVPTPKGNEQARVISTFFEDISLMPLPANRYKKVISVFRGRAAHQNETCEGNKIYTNPVSDNKRCVNVIFEMEGKKYSYLCEDYLIGVDDFVIVSARGKEKVVKVVEVFEEFRPKWKPVIRRATKWEIDEVRELFDDYYKYQDDEEEEDEEPDFLAEEEEEDDEEELEIRLSIITNFNYDDDEDEDEILPRRRNGITDERGYLRDSRAEAYEAQLRKAAKLGRLTDDRGYILDPYFPERLRENFAHEELYLNGYHDDEDEYEDEYE